jgi:WD40 repeat protein
VGTDSTDGIFAVTPKGQLVTGALKLWDSVTHEKLKEVPLSPGFTWANSITFSPDGSLAAITDVSGKGCVLETKTWKVVQDFSQPYAGRYGVRPSLPHFTADGHFLMFPCRQSDGKGHYTIAPRAYDTKSWQQYDKLPGLPENALACIQAPKRKRAVLLLKGNTMVLWNSERRVEYAKLQEHVRIKEVAFSPDESMVAVSTGKDGEDDWTIDNVSVWKMDTGELVHRLRPFEAGFCENVAGLQWTRDGNYLLAGTKSDPFFSDSSIDIWNVRSGRHRGTFLDGIHYLRGVAILPDGRHVAAGSTCVVRFWDLAAALKQIRTFEESIPTPK